MADHVHNGCPKCPPDVYIECDDPDCEDPPESKLCIEHEGRRAMGPAETFFRSLLSPEWQRHLDAALDEARRGVAKSGALMIIGLAQDLFAAQAALEGAREEAAQVVSHMSTGTGKIDRDDAVGKICALADKPPPDTGWRDRQPTETEQEAHEDRRWLWSRGNVVGVEARAYAYLHEDGDRWRPVTRELWPAPWPEPEPEPEPERDVECLCGNNVGAICHLHFSEEA